MTTTEEPQENTPSRRTVDKAQYLVCVVLVAVGAFLIYDAVTLEAGFAKVDPVGPKLFPIAIGVILIVLAISPGGRDPARFGRRGRRGGGRRPEHAERLAHRRVCSSVLFVATDPAGRTRSAGPSPAHSSSPVRRQSSAASHYVRNIVIGAVLAVSSFYAFYSGLGIPLPAGILDGIL